MLLNKHASREVDEIVPDTKCIVVFASLRFARAHALGLLGSFRRADSKDGGCYRADRLPRGWG